MSDADHPEGLIEEPCFSPLAIAGINHHTADVATIEEFRFPDETAFLADTRERFKGAVLLQTCNRVEVLVHGDGQALAEFLEEKGRNGFALFKGTEALRHILEISCGIDSMIVGEDQIIGQLRTAMTHAQEAGTSDSILELCINKAIHVGIECRKRTRINRGAVSVGSAAVQLAEEQIGSLRGRHILVIGSGEMGLLVTQALAAKDLTAIYVANRTHERAVILAEKIGGKAVTFDELNRYLVLSDVVISCTAAPHPIIRECDLREVMKGRCWPLDGHPRPLILIDIAQPRDIEESAGTIPGVHLFTIDDLRQVNDCAMASRQEEAERAMGFLNDELAHFVHLLNRKAADDTIAILHTWAEAIRLRERDRAVNRFPAKDEKTAGIIDDLTRVLVTKLLNDATFSIRSCAETGDLDSAESLVSAIVKGEKVCIRKEE
jgi:glutamyl-tRNA reductase